MRTKSPQDDCDEDLLHNLRIIVSGSRSHRHLPSTAAHHPVSATCRIPLLQRLGKAVPMADRTPAAGKIHFRIPRKQGNAAEGQDNISGPVVDRHPCSHDSPCTMPMGQPSTGSRACRCHNTYTHAQDCTMTGRNKVSRAHRLPEKCPAHVAADCMARYPSRAHVAHIQAVDKGKIQITVRHSEAFLQTGRIFRSQ